MEEQALKLKALPAPNKYSELIDWNKGKLSKQCRQPGKMAEAERVTFTTETIRTKKSVPACNKYNTVRWDKFSYKIPGNYKQKDATVNFTVAAQALDNRTPYYTPISPNTIQTRERVVDFGRVAVNPRKVNERIQRLEQTDTLLPLDVEEAVKKTRATLLSERYISSPQAEKTNFYAIHMKQKSYIPGIGEYENDMAGRDYIGPQSPKSIRRKRN